MVWISRGLGALMMWLASCFPAAQATETQGEGAPVLAWVELRPVPQKPDFIEIIGRAQGISTASGRYALDVRRGGPSGSSNSRQDGQFQVAPGEAAALSRTTINFPKGSDIEIVLTLYVDGQPVSSSTIKGRF